MTLNIPQTPGRYYLCQDAHSTGAGRPAQPAPLTDVRTSTPMHNDSCQTGYSFWFVFTSTVPHLVVPISVKGTVVNRTAQIRNLMLFLENFILAIWSVSPLIL